MYKKNYKKISVGIPTFNSSIYLKDCLRSLEKLVYIDEVIISDDCSNDIELDKINKIIKSYKEKLPIVFIKNSKNYGAFVNKLNLIKASKNEFIYILDSDNLAGKNLDKIIKKYINSGSCEKFLIQPNIMYQFWKFPLISKYLSYFIKKYKVKFFKENTVLDYEYVKKSLLLNSGTYDLKLIAPNFNFQQINTDFDDCLQTKWIFWVLNCGNFIVNKKLFINIAEKGLKFDRSIRSVDAIVFAYLWIANGYKIKIIKNFYHHHRKREDSVSYIEKEDSVNAITYFIKKFLVFEN